MVNKQITAVIIRTRIRILIVMTTKNRRQRNRKSNSDGTRNSNGSGNGSSNCDCNSTENMDNKQHKQTTIMPTMMSIIVITAIMTGINSKPIMRVISTIRRVMVMVAAIPHICNQSFYDLFGCLDPERCAVSLGYHTF